MEKLISLCMIVKNEVLLLPRCLESIKGLADEIIVIDTGSTDRTKEIAQQYHAMVYDFQWISDFAAARNESIRHATGKWILWMDADEYWDPMDVPGIREFLMQLDATKPVGIVTPIINYMGSTEQGESVESASIRIFSNHPHVLFENPIHEQVVSKKNDMNFHRFPFYIYHTGYTKQVREQKDKSNRNMAIFESLARTRKLTSYEQYTLGNEYMVKRDYKKALYYYQKATSQKKNAEGWVIHCISQFIHAYLNLERFKEAYDLIEKYLPQWSKYPDFYTYKGIVYTYFGCYDLAITEFEKAINIAEKSGQSRFWLISPNLGSTIPFTKLVEIYSETLDKPKVIYYLTKLIQANPADQVSLYKLINSLLQSEQPDAIIPFLDKLLPIGVPRNLKRLFLVCLMVGTQSLSEHYYHKCLQNGVDLADSLIVRYSIVTENRDMFEAVWEASFQTAPEQVAKYGALAALLWKKPEFLSQMNQDVTSVCLTLLQDVEPVPIDSKNLNPIFTLLTELFQMGYYETYDWLLHRVRDGEDTLKQLLGDFFFNQYQFELAIDHYGFLLERDKLSGKGYENLSRLYRMYNETDDSNLYLQQAIRLHPDKIRLYMTYCRNSLEHTDKSDMKKRLLDRFPQHKGLPFIAAL